MSRTEIKPIRRDRYGGPSHHPVGTFAHERRYLEPEARFAGQIIERWAMVAGEPDGEDSVGRSKLALLAPEDLVKRGCDIAEKAFAEFAARGWVIDIPSLDELEEEIKREEDQRENK